MKFPYAVRRSKKGTEYYAWSPFEHYIHGCGSTKAEAIKDLIKQMQEIMNKCDGELGEINI